MARVWSAWAENPVFQEKLYEQRTKILVRNFHYNFYYLFQLNQNILTTKIFFTCYLGHLTVSKMTLFSITPLDIKQSPSSSKVCRPGLEKWTEDSKLTSLNTVRKIINFYCYHFVILKLSIVNQHFY